MEGTEHYVIFQTVEVFRRFRAVEFRTFIAKQAHPAPKAARAE